MSSEAVYFLTVLEKCSLFSDCANDTCYEVSPSGKLWASLSSECSSNFLCPRYKEAQDDFRLSPPEMTNFIRRMRSVTQPASQQRFHPAINGRNLQVTLKINVDMFRRKLTALDYHNPDGFDNTDETQFRNCIVWLEDQKIRHYKIEDRGNLRNIPSSDWPRAYQKYLQDVSCPFGVQERQEALDWLLGLAVRYEYGDNVEKYRKCEPLSASVDAKSVDPLVNLDSNSPDFKAGVTALANILKIQRHDDYLVMLKAIRILIQERLSPEAIAKASHSKEGIPVTLDKHTLGFDTGDATLNEAAQILRLLHIEELRELQTKINEAIVAVQAIIADPKTDHRLGKVGR